MMLSSPDFGYTERYTTMGNGGHFCVDDPGKDEMVVRGDLSMGQVLRTNIRDIC